MNGVWSVSDKWGALKVRLGINRGNYKVEPGLYGMNNPGRESPVFVTANYKLTVDVLRRELGGLDCHILVLDTRGINVWFAAGKGTFGTAELIRRIEMTGLASRLDHRVLILPQLGAPGVSARDVKKDSGFRVIHGPVEARDIAAFLAADRKKTARMRTKSFSWRDRLVLTPLLLPVIPARPFALKGALTGAVLLGLWIFLARPTPGNLFSGGGMLLVISSFTAMNFTGASA